jgi:hypothetical protein
VERPRARLEDRREPASDNQSPREPRFRRVQVHEVGPLVVDDALQPDQLERKIAVGCPRCVPSEPTYLRRVKQERRKVSLDWRRDGHAPATLRLIDCERGDGSGDSGVGRLRYVKDAQPANSYDY